VEHIKNNPERNVLGTSDEGITRNLASNNETNGGKYQGWNYKEK